MTVRRYNLVRDRINNYNLIELGSKRHGFTCCGPLYLGGHRTYEKPDRAFGNEEWRLKFPDAQVKVLARVDFLDHHPILIMPYYQVNMNAIRLFKFESS